MSTGNIEERNVRRFAWITAILCAAIIALGGLVAFAIIRERDDQNRTCQVQSAGLAANTHLRLFLTDLNAAELQPQSEARNKKQLAKLPPRLRAIEKQMLAELNAYVDAERRLPPHRQC